MLTQMTGYKIFHYHHEQKNKKSNFTLFSLLSGQSTVKRKGCGKEIILLACLAFINDRHELPIQTNTKQMKVCGTGY
jgi:hypothetical protein